jgi:hypothetical protein
MHKTETRKAPRAMALAAAGMLAAASLGAGAAQGPSEWQFNAVGYGWLPSVSGDLWYNRPRAGDGLTVDAADILDDLQFTFMFTLEARKGPWLAFTDLIYLDLEGDKSRSVSLPEGGSIELFDADVSLSGWLWTLAGGYNFWRHDGSYADAFAGLRLFSIESDAKLTGVLGRERKASESDDIWDGIIGVKGRFALADRWFLPYYADIGTGDSDTTWQLAGGVGYTFHWGEVALLYRYLQYDQGDDKLLQGVSFGGPMLAVGFRF